MRFFVISVCLLLIPLSAAPQAQGADAAAYRDVAARRGIEADVVYLTADAPLPETAVAPPPPPKAPANAGDGADGGLIVILLSLAVLAGALFAAARFGGARTASFARAPEAALRRRAAPRPPAPGPETLDLARIAAIADRRTALEALWLAALARAATLHGLTIGRSWTARDALGHLPAGWVHRPALIRIARAAELAHFGGREVPEDQFRALLDAAAPIFAGRGA